MEFVLYYTTNLLWAYMRWRLIMVREDLCFEVKPFCFPKLTVSQKNSLIGSHRPMVTESFRRNVCQLLWKTWPRGQSQCHITWSLFKALVKDRQQLKGYINSSIFSWSLSLQDKEIANWHILSDSDEPFLASQLNLSKLHTKNGFTVSAALHLFLILFFASLFFRIDLTNSSSQGTTKIYVFIQSTINLCPSSNK